MNNTINELFQRKSVRVFTEQKISKEDKDLIIQSAIQAPTAGNCMFYSIIDITDQNIKDKLSITCDNQPFIKDADLVLIFVADYDRMYRGFVMSMEEEIRTPGEGDMLLAFQDAIIAAQNSVVAAESLGIGSCYIGDIIEEQEQIKELLNIPEFAIPITMLVFGYPTQQQKSRNKPERFIQDKIVHENSYKPYTEEDFVKMHQKDIRVEGESFRNVLKRLGTRKYTSEFALEMTRSSKKWMENFLTKE